MYPSTVLTLRYNSLIVIIIKIIIIIIIIIASHEDEMNDKYNDKLCISNEGIREMSEEI